MGINLSIETVIDGIGAVSSKCSARNAKTKTTGTRSTMAYFASANEKKEKFQMRLDLLRCVE